MKENVYDKALSLLAIREHNEKELKLKLKNKGYGEEEINGALNKLKEEGSLSEERYILSFITSRMKKNPEGKNILILRLLEKGADKDTVKVIVNEYWEKEEYIDPLKKEYIKLKEKNGDLYARTTLLKKGFLDREIREALNEE